MRAFSYRTAAALLAALAAMAQTPAPKKAPPGSTLEERTGASRVTWRTRTLVGNDRLMRWKTGPAATAFPQLTLTESAAKADALGLTFLEASNQQKVSPEIQKNLDVGLSAADIASVNEALKAANVKICDYRVEGLTADRKTFEFAKAIGVDLIVGNPSAAALADIEKLAGEFSIKVAIPSATPLEGRGNMLGYAIDSATWMQAGAKPDRVAAVKDRLMAVSLRARDVGPALTPFFNEMNRLDIRPLVLTLNPLAAGGDLAMVTDAFEKAVQPALGAFVTALSKNTPIRSGDKLPDDVKARIDAAIPRTAYAKPKKPRKLLVIDACIANMSHNTIPHFNLAIELMAKHTGAFEPVFSNDLDNLRWPKIKEWDAIYLNDTVGELFPDLEIRESLVRYVKEGGGLGGWHGSPWASRSWRELGEMVGAMDAPHRIEPAYIKVDDTKNPINQAFDGTGIEHTEEFYRFHDSGPTAFYSRDKVHVLLSLDMSKSPAVDKPDRSGQPFYHRKDNDYAVAWIRNYGKGRIFYNSMGHMPETMMSKPIMGHVFGAIQFILGDLDADTTPSAKLAKK